MLIFATPIGSSTLLEIGGRTHPLSAAQVHDLLALLATERGGCTITINGGSTYALTAGDKIELQSQLEIAFVAVTKFLSTVKNLDTEREKLCQNA